MAAAIEGFAPIQVGRGLPDLVGQLQAGHPQVLVTVVGTQGSTPRETGARMWIGSHGVAGSIGGGNLEWQAIAHANDMLRLGLRQYRLERYPLGPALGQCCGGVVWLLFELLDREDASWLGQIDQGLSRGLTMTRIVDLPHVPRRDGVRSDAAGTRILPTPGMLRPDSARVLLTDEAGACGWTHLDTGFTVVADIWSAPVHHVVLCGVGHIGSAIIRLLADLPVRVICLDSRDDFRPDPLPSNVQWVQGDADDVPDMPDHAYWLVMTHSHALDLAIIDAVLRHKSFAFLGLIGSATKKARFVSRLSRRHDPDLVARVCCPVGIVQTSSKLPAVIAISVVAQLLDRMAA